VRIALTHQGNVLASSRDMLNYFTPENRQWLMVEGRREQDALVGGNG